MLRPTVVCYKCHQGSEKHAPIVQDANGRVVYGGECTTLRTSNKRNAQLPSLR